MTFACVDSDLQILVQKQIKKMKMTTKKKDNYQGGIGNNNLY